MMTQERTAPMTRPSLEAKAVSYSARSKRVVPLEPIAAVENPTHAHAGVPQPLPEFSRRPGRPGTGLAPRLRLLGDTVVTDGASIAALAALTGVRTVAADIVTRLARPRLARPPIGAGRGLYLLLADARRLPACRSRRRLVAGGLV